MASDPSIPDIYFVCPWFGIFAGGAERAARTLAIELQRRGWKIEILTTCSSDLLGDWSENGFDPGLEFHDGLSIRRFEVNTGRMDRYRNAVHEWATGRPVSETSMYDFFRCGISSQALVDYVGGIPNLIPIVAIPYFHSLTFETIEAYPGRIDLFGCFHDEPQFKWAPVSDMLRSARRILLMAEEEKDLVINTYGRSLGRNLVESPIVGMGVELPAGDLELLDSPERLNDLRKRLGIGEQFFLTVGRKDSGKGLEQLLRWYSEFASRGPRKAPPLVFLGPGAKDAIPSKEHFIDLGFVSEAEKVALMEGAAATINLSTNEAFSLVLMESWLAGTPVVVSADCPVTAGHCNRSGGGLAVGDSGGFRAALSTFLDPELQRIAGACGRDYVTSQFNWDRVTDRFARALEQPCEF